MISRELSTCLVMVNGDPPDCDHLTQLHDHLPGLAWPSTGHVLPPAGGSEGEELTSQTGHPNTISSCPSMGWVVVRGVLTMNPPRDRLAQYDQQRTN